MSRTLFVSAVAAAALTGCNPDRFDDPPTTQDAMLQRFDTCGELQGYAVDAYTEMLIQYRYGGYGWYGPEEGDVDSGADDGGGGSDGPRDYSETNNQEAGVDEPDIVKTDGEFIYVAGSRGDLRIVKSWPAADAAAVGHLELDGYPYSLFLHGDRVVIFSYVYDYDGDNLDDDGFRGGYATRMTIVDVSDRTAPEVVREVDVEGWFVNARKIDSDVYVVINSGANMPQEVWDLAWTDTLGLPEMNWEATEEEQEAIREEARRILRPEVARIVNDQGADALLPRVFDHLPGEQVDGEPLLGCTDVYHPDGISRPSILTVAHLDLDEGDRGGQLSGTGLMSEGWTVYASENALYVAQSSWWWWWGWGDLDLNTHIHKFSLDGDNTTYEASGEVEGWLLNQFSMGEHDGHLRVATTDIDWWWGSGATDEEEAEEPANNVFVLREDGADLEIVGEVRGIAPNEQIYASRFIGDDGYLVTFRQIDPLFTLDLSDPTDPQVLGELEIPGYSSYLHPVGDDHLLAVGMDGTDDGQILGFAVSLFDVSDKANPTRVDQLTISSDDWSWSESLWDHHAFTFHRGVLSVPIYTYDYDESGYWDGFSGMLAVNVDVEGGALTETGRVSHEDLVDESECLYSYYYDDGGTSEGGSDGGTEVGACPDYYWYANMRRSVVIEDNLFSISDYGIKVNDLNDPATEIARVVFYPAE